MTPPTDRNDLPRSERRDDCRGCRDTCLCEDLARRRAYDAARARKGLVALYRPPSMR